MYKFQKFKIPNCTKCLRRSAIRFYRFSCPMLQTIISQNYRLYEEFYGKCLSCFFLSKNKEKCLIFATKSLQISGSFKIPRFARKFLQSFQFLLDPAKFMKENRLFFTIKSLQINGMFKIAIVAKKNSCKHVILDAQFVDLQK